MYTHICMLQTLYRRVTLVTHSIINRGRQLLPTLLLMVFLSTELGLLHSAKETVRFPKIKEPPDYPTVHIRLPIFARDTVGFLRAESVHGSQSCCRVTKHHHRQRQISSIEDHRS